jgi:hypothetical protein
MAIYRHRHRLERFVVRSSENAGKRFGTESATIGFAEEFERIGEIEFETGKIVRIGENGSERRSKMTLMINADG